MTNPMLTDRRILLAVTGGIAAYKAADLASRLRRAGAGVRVAMTDAATRFVSPMTFESLVGYPVYRHVFDQPSAWEMEHISWARWGDTLLIAPATANTLARLANGLADDAVTTLALAFTGPLWVAPAMNTAMWEHPATRANLALLRERGARIIDPGSGPLACGEVGAGRMAEPEQIVEALAAEPVGSASTAATPAARSLAGRRVLITTGPTLEALDPIRYISNRSSGRMGCELAAAALGLGAEVDLVHGPMRATPPPGARLHPVESAAQMLEAVQAAFDGADIALFAAAVANFAAGEAAAEKIKEGESLTLTLQRTRDIAAWCGAHRRPGQLLVGFAAESRDLMNSAQRKLETKRLDLICANRIGDPELGFAADRNQVTLLAPDGSAEESPAMVKGALAGWIWERLIARLDTPGVPRQEDPAPARTMA